MQLEERIKNTKLFEIYKNCLEENQKTLLSSFLNDDLQISEIAELKGISRQAVSKNINICLAKLNKLEEEIKFFEKFEKLANQIEKLKSSVTPQSKTFLEKLESILKEVL